ncbi:MAG: GNAT family N-acetyltransferase [bacterium]|nr:GNAT family N-acetyltransferase [bacterium]
MKLQKQADPQKINNQTDEKQVLQCYDLWNDCFGDSKEYMGYYFENKLKDNQVYVIEEEDQVISMLHLNPFSMSLKGREHVYHYIVGVATQEEKRGRGCMRNVLTKALREQREAGEIFTYLMPAAKEIYLPYDFRYIYTQDRVSGSITSDAALSSNRVVKPYMELSDHQKQEVVLFVMEHLEGEFELYTVRDKAYYERLVLEMQAAGGEVIAVYNDLKLEGVCSYMLENGHMEVVETITSPELTEQIENAILSYALIHAKEKSLQVAWLETHFLNRKVLQALIQDSEYKKQPIIMARLLDAEQALSLLTLKKEEENAVTLKLAVRDPLILENQKTYKVTASMTQTVVEETEEDYEVYMNIAELTQFFFESASINELAFETKGMEKSQAITILEKFSGCKNSYINEIV